MPLRWKVRPGERRARSSMFLRPCASIFSWLNAIDADRHVLQPLLAARGGDDDFLESRVGGVGGVGRCGARRRRENERHREHSRRSGREIESLHGICRHPTPLHLCLFNNNFRRLRDSIAQSVACPLLSLGA